MNLFKFFVHCKLIINTWRPNREVDSI